MIEGFQTKSAPGVKKARFGYSAGRLAEEERPIARQSFGAIKPAAIDSKMSFGSGTSIQPHTIWYDNP
ncbi:hypothetical protein U1T56_24080, partial [Geminicoccaceae bacterium SYSU G07066]